MYYPFAGPPINIIIPTTGVQHEAVVSLSSNVAPRELLNFCRICPGFEYAVTQGAVLRANLLGLMIN